MTTENFLPLLQQYLNATLSLNQLEKLGQYLHLIFKWNKTYNLTAITKPEDMVIKHVLDSLSINAYLHGDNIIDVGTGAGLPGIPLAIANPDKQFTLIDSNSKKVRFLNQVKLELDLKNIIAVHTRAEDYKPEHCFDCVTTRAFSSLNAMLAKTKHLCCKFGVFLAMKGIFPAEELAEISKEFKVNWVKKLEVPELAAERHLICLSTKI